MSSSQLAKRLEITQSSVSEMEKNESRGSITLSTLERAANALECELVYALVPRRSLEKTVTEQIRKYATDQVRRVNHTMLLEDQAVSKTQIRHQVEELVREMMTKPPRAMWDQ
jgi:predicted DNA-binding mobile mystery protein A